MKRNKFFSGKRCSDEKKKNEIVTLVRIIFNIK